MTTLVPINQITDLTMQILLRNGVREEDAEVIISHLLDGELAGHPSHGFYRIPSIVNGTKRTGPGGEIICEQQTETFALIDGGSRPGLVVALRAAEVAIAKAKEQKIAVVGARNYVGTTGSMGYYTKKIADSDLIGIVIANSGAATPPWGGIQPIFGTNPISVAVPSQNEAIVVDLATSKWSYGNIDLALKDGQRLPLGVVQDKYGNPSTDPNDALNGSMLPFGEHKGYALALAVEILAGPLIKAKAGANAVPGPDGFLVCAISPEIFGPISTFKESVSRLITEIKTSERKPGVEELFYPGERSARARLENRRAGQIAMVDRILADLQKLAVGYEESVENEDYI